MLGLSRLIRCSLQPRLFCLGNPELLPLILLGLPLLPLLLSWLWPDRPVAGGEISLSSRTKQLVTQGKKGM